MWGMALSVRCMVFRKDPEARRVASASGSCQGRRTESFRSITSSLPGDDGLLPTPLGHLLFDVDAVVVEHLFQCGKQAPAITVLILFGLGREKCERLVFVQSSPTVVDGRTVVKADEVLHRVECAGTFVGIYPRLALGCGVLHLEPLVVELRHGIVELGGIFSRSDMVGCKTQRAVEFGVQVLHEDVVAADTLVRNALAFLDRQAIDMRFQVFDVIFRHSRGDLDVEPAVPVREVLGIVSLHLLLGTQFVEQHFPLVLIAQTVDHLGHTDRTPRAVVLVGEHVEHLRHDEAAEQTAVGYGSLFEDVIENRVVVVQNRQLAVLVRSDIIASVGSLHGEQAAHVHADTAERFDAFVRRFGQLCLFG